VVISPRDRQGRLKTSVQEGGSRGTLGHSEKYEAVLQRYGLGHSSMAVIGADRQPESETWQVMVTGDLQPVYLDVDAAGKLENDLRGIGEMVLAERIGAAVETAKRQMRPRE